MAIDIALARTDADLASCFAVLVQLRPQLTADDCVPRLRQQQQTGYQLALLREDGAVRAVAGFRLGLNLAWGRHLYVDDLATDAGRRGRGHGHRLFAWLCAHAEQHGCAALHLDSGVQRFDAHRFYLAQRMRISSHHFALALPRR